MSNFKPRGKYVLVRASEISDISAGGIYLPQSEQDGDEGDIITGEVIGIGQDVEDLEIGEIALFVKISAFDLDNRMLVVLQDHIFATKRAD
jgi:co-chaperonin GroES (HSP10)